MELRTKTAQVKNLTAQNFTADQSTLNVDTLNAETTNSQQLFIDDKLFPTSTIPIKINEPQIISNATGLYALGSSFTGKVRFENCQTLSLNLVNLVLTGDSDCALEIVNCNQLIIFNGSVNNPVGTAICIQDSTDITLSNVNTRDTVNGCLITDSEVITVRNYYLQNITGYGIRFEDTNNISMTKVHIREVSSFSGDALIQGLRSESIFIRKSTFTDIEYIDVEEVEKSIIKLEDNCFDIKVTNVSILRVVYRSMPGTDLNVNHVYLVNSGSAILGGFFIDGNGMEVSGDSSGTHNCIRVDNGNNIFIEPNLITDNYVQGDASATVLKMHAISIFNVLDMVIKGNKINSNYALGGSVITRREVRSFYGEQGGNWILAKIQANSNHVRDLTLGSTYGFEIVDVTYYVKLVDCTSNNNGVSQGGGRPNTAGGILISGGANQGGVDLVNCVSNSNVSAVLTTGIFSTQDNTLVKSCVSNDNKSNTNAVYSFLFPGTSTHQQHNVAVFNCTGNNSHDGLLSTTHGVFSGVLALGGGIPTLGAVNVEIKKCNFNANTYGARLIEVQGASLIGNFLNKNVTGLHVAESETVSVIANSAIGNDNGFVLESVTSAVVQKNLSHGNGIGFRDTSVSGNQYMTNTAKDNTTAYDTPSFAISVHQVDPLTGLYTFVSGQPTLNSLTNIQ